MALISIIAPCLNEEANLKKYYDTIVDVFSRAELKAHSFELIIADNASSDNSRALIRKLADDDKRVKAVFNARNVGVFVSSFNALSYASGDAVFLMVPVDMQDPPSLIPEFVKHWEQGHLVVAGRRLKRQESALMRFLRNNFYRFLSGISTETIRPGIGEYQLVDRKVVDELLAIPDINPMPRGLLGYLGYVPKIIDYEWQRRKDGKSKFSLYMLIQTALSMTLTFSKVPIRSMFIVGLILSAASLSYSIILFFAAMIEGRLAAPGITTILVAVFFFSGIQLVFLGILGAYIGRIYDQVRIGRRVSVVAELNFEPRKPGAKSRDATRRGSGSQPSVPE